MDAKPSLPYPLLTPPSRARSHRKRLSITRLSSESTPALPVYLRTEDLPDDRPPDYPESAHEADDDTDTSAPDTLLPLSSPRPRRHRRRHSASPVTSPSGDPYLDSLLARSVHALEMSNALLQSSISTHTSLSAVLAVDSPVIDSSLEARARDLTSRIRVNSKVHANWMDDLAAISEHITIDSPPDALGLSLAHEDPISRSLPTDPSPLRLRAPHHRNHSSSDLRLIKADTVDSVEPHLRLSNWCRSRLISPAPRALTQYVESNADPDAIYLPSTLGLRSASSTHFPSGVSSPPPPLAPTASSPPHSAGHEPSTAAHTLLSSFLARRSSTSSAGSHVSSRSYPERLVKATTETATSSSRTSSTVIPSRTLTPHSSPSRSRVGKRSLSLPPVPPPLVLTNRPLTPPTENPSLSSLSSASSSNTSSDPHPNPVLSLQALRKILDDQPRPSTSSHAPPEGRAPRRPSFHPRTPLPAPTLGTSTATASVSRLFTKPVHMHSGSSSREPRQSALKGGLRTPQSPASSNGGLLAPDQNTGPGGSSASSARSTPKRISFAELPEPYGSERGGGSGRGFEKKRSKKAKKRSGKGKGRSKGDDADAGSDGSDGDDDNDKGWWAKLLLGTGSARNLSLGRREERVESRIARGLGSRGGFGGGIEDWAV